MNNANKTFIDITNLTDAALDVFLSVKAGDDCVTVDHLSPSERYAVAEALGIKAPAHWVMNSYPEPSRKARYTGPDAEALILDEQESEESWWT